MNQLAFRRGFTLLEMLIALAIVGILAVIAYPSYREQVAVSRRNEAVNALLIGAQALERYYSVNGRYTTGTTNNTLPLVYPQQVPDSGAAYYTLAAFGTPAPGEYRLRARRTGMMTGDACGDLMLDQAGVMSLVDVPPRSAKSLANCWRR